MSLQRLARTVLPIVIGMTVLDSTSAQTTIVIEPAPFADGADISHAFPGAALSALGSDPVSGAVLKQTATNGLPQPMPVLGHDGGFEEFWFDVFSVGDAFLRIDFDQPADVVNVDFLMNNGFDPTVLQAFDSGGTLLETVTTPGTSGPGSIETATIDRGGSFDIDHIVAGAQPSQDLHIRRVDATVREPACLTLGFDTEDDFVTPLVNGQHVDTEFGTLVSITSTGFNAGLAIFDSTAGGPNDPSQDRDLLVDTGNILILQTENFPPDGNDVFPRPNDDDDGGTISFALAMPLEPLSLRLIDLDPGDGTTAVVLTDATLRERTYTVPSNWTGDLTTAGPGHGTLDLTILAPQPGFGSVATAVEDGGFDPASVVVIHVALNGSGGVDDLALCTAGLPRAAAEMRNGSGVNPVSLASHSRPVLGTTWRSDLDCSAQGSGLAVLEIRARARGGRMTPFGEVLVGGPLLHREVRVHSGIVNPFTWDIPLDLSLLGLDAHVQGACLIPASFSAHRLMQARSRLSNALDLTLGL